MESSSRDGGKAEILALVCNSLDQDDGTGARALLRSRYPFTPVTKVARRYTARDCMRVFFRDGFVDRYTGTQLVHPGALRLLSIVLPDEFPFHRNWDTSKTHFAFYELFPTVDHLVPVARGGLDTDSNWVTTSMLRNSAKAQWTLEELGWSLVPPGDLAAWDGLTEWFVSYLTAHPALQRENKYLHQWFTATVSVQSNE